MALFRLAILANVGEVPPYAVTVAVAQATYVAARSVVFETTAFATLVVAHLANLRLVCRHAQPLSLIAQAS